MAYSLHDLQDTIVALATPPGVGAIGVIRLSGKDAIAIVDQVFHGKDLNKQESHTAHFGTIRDDSGRIVDEVLVTVFVAPRSYTGENVVEVSCHGSNYIIQELIRLFIKKGARTAQRGEFTLRAFLNGRMDLSQAEAVADLIASDSEQSHALALQQMRGGISEEIAELRQQLLDFASLIELELDFSEEDVEFANRDELRQLVEKIQRLIRHLLDSFRLGNAIKQGVTTVIAGRPNAGKSTLLNALLNEERAIVSEIAGTTRDTIEEVLNINGVLFRIVDTAGIREAQDQIEAIGVEKTLEKVRQSSLLVYVYDVVNTPEEEVEKDLAKLSREGVGLIVVGNKVDLAPPLTPPHGGGGHTPSREVVARWMTADSRGYDQLKAYAREMRKYQTPAEEIMWQALRGKKLDGYTFRRQHIIGHFIADFVCLGEKLIIELDGRHHQLPEVQLSDQERTRILEADGYNILRFQNEEILNNLPQVLQEIKAALFTKRTTNDQAATVTLPRGEGRGGAIFLSAKQKQNIDALKQELYEAVISEKISLDNQIISNARHFEALEKAYTSLTDVLTGMDQGITSDFVAMDIRRALSYLGEITGQVTTDDLLGNIFGRFCIGK
ncbi:MAG: tRNA uridine-5-carboxymethylaminomethyl(34) synthesis GTPase MnmE [Saprospiraceae bacterium]